MTIARRRPTRLDAIAAPVPTAPPVAPCPGIGVPLPRRRCTRARESVDAVRAGCGAARSAASTACRALPGRPNCRPTRSCASTATARSPWPSATSRQHGRSARLYRLGHLPPRRGLKARRPGQRRSRRLRRPQHTARRPSRPGRASLDVRSAGSRRRGPEDSGYSLFAWTVVRRLVGSPRRTCRRPTCRHRSVMSSVTPSSLQTSQGTVSPAHQRDVARRSRSSRPRTRLIIMPVNISIVSGVASMPRHLEDGLDERHQGFGIDVHAT